MIRLTRRQALYWLAMGAGLAGLGFAGGSVLVGRSGSGGTSGQAGGDTTMMGGASRGDMNSYMDLFNRHGEITRTVEAIPGGIRTTTESGVVELAAQLQAHVTSMYRHLEEGAEVVCMSPTLPTLFRSAGDYRREFVSTAKGVVVSETSTDPMVVAAIRAHANEVSGFVRDGMPAIMAGMMG
jgi:hypothetical protein